MDAIFVTCINLLLNGSH